MKFKPGDRVTFLKITNGSDGREQFLNKTITLVEPESNNEEDVRWLFEENGYWIVRESEIVLDIAYNSPLYQALK